jgi:hypothetical protein
VDNYPQPRPVLYGTSAEDATPQTQTTPVRTGPPRWPPAPPFAEFAPDPSDGNGKGSRWNSALASAPRPLISAFLGFLYMFAVAYSFLQVFISPAGFADPFTGRLILLVEVALGVLVTLSLWWLDGLGYLTALFPALLQIVPGVVFGQWLLPGFWMAVVVCTYLLLPSMRSTYGRQALWTAKKDIARWKQRHPRRHRCKPIDPPRDMPDYWRSRW